VDDFVLHGSCDMHGQCYHDVDVSLISQAQFHLLFDICYTLQRVRESGYQSYWLLMMFDQYDFEE
jgi:hypothetical protein